MLHCNILWHWHKKLHYNIWWHITFYDILPIFYDKNFAKYSDYNALIIFCILSPLHTWPGIQTLNELNWALKHKAPRAVHHYRPGNGLRRNFNPWFHGSTFGAKEFFSLTPFKLQMTRDQLYTTRMFHIYSYINLFLSSTVSLLCVVILL